MTSILNLHNDGFAKTTKNLNLSINRKTSRGVSADSKKKSPACLNQLTFNKLVAQTNKHTDKMDTIMKRNQEKIHSMSPSKKMDENTCLIPPQPASKINKKTLILDLDETLIHSGFRPFEGGNDIILKIEIEGTINDIYVVKRPGVDEFLERMAKCYELVIFTASLAKYADPLMDILDKNKLCSYRLFRDSCTMINGFYVKELKRLNRNMKNVILLDNNPVSYYLDIENGVPIKSFYEDKTDNELHAMAYVLENLAQVNDVRDYIKEIVYINQVDYERAKEIFSSAQEGNPQVPTNNQPTNLTNNIARYSAMSETNSINSSNNVSTTRINAGNKNIKDENKSSKLKILSVDVIDKSNQQHTNRISKITVRSTPRDNKLLNSLDGKVNIQSSNIKYKTPYIKKDNSIKKNLNLITPKYISTNDTYLKENKETDNIITNKLSISTVGYKSIKSTKRPSSVNSFKSKLNQKRSTTTMNDSSHSNLNSNVNSSKHSTSMRRAKETPINFKNESRNSSLSSKKTPYKFSSSTYNSNSKSNIKIKGINNCQKSLEIDSKFGMNTTRFNKIIPIYKTNFTSKSNKSLSPFRDIKEDLNRFNPKTTRINGGFLNFKKDASKDRLSSKEKFNSLLMFTTNTKTEKTNKLSISQNSHYLNKIKSSNSKIKTNANTNNKLTHSDLKIVKIVSNKEFTRSKTNILKESISNK